jgi:hypothetical protein
MADYKLIPKNKREEAKLFSAGPIYIWQQLEDVKHEPDRQLSRQVLFAKISFFSSMQSLVY